MCLFKTMRHWVDFPFRNWKCNIFFFNLGLDHCFVAIKWWVKVVEYLKNSLLCVCIGGILKMTVRIDKKGCFLNKLENCHLWHIKTENHEYKIPPNVTIYYPVVSGHWYHGVTRSAISQNTLLCNHFSRTTWTLESVKPCFPKTLPYLIMKIVNICYIRLHIIINIVVSKKSDSTKTGTESQEPVSEIELLYQIL